MDEMVPPQCHIVPPSDGRRPPYLVSQREWPTETILDKAVGEEIIPQLLDFGSGRIDYLSLGLA